MFNHKIGIGLLSGVLAIAASQSAHSAEYALPEVEPCGAAIQLSLSGGLNNLMCLKGTVTGNDMNTSGTYVASIHDEFISYSIEALALVQGETSWLPESSYGDWSKVKAGSGTIDIGVLVKTSGGGSLNNPDPFPDAASSNTSDTIYWREWGGDTGTDTNDPGSDPNDPILTVQEVVDWLNPQSVPVFFFDLAEPQNDPVTPLYFSGRVYITDATGANVLETWAFDNLFDGEYSVVNDPLVDPSNAYMVLAPKNVPVYIPGSGCTDYQATLGTDWCNVKNSSGSGKPDFVAYALDMSLSGWAKDGNLFWANFKIDSNSAADEEIFLTKRVGTPVPEPATLSLMGLGMLALFFFRRRNPCNRRY